jgi:hypothetical protein
VPAGPTNGERAAPHLVGHTKHHHAAARIGKTHCVLARNLQVFLGPLRGFEIQMEAFEIVRNMVVQLIQQSQNFGVGGRTHRDSSISA